MMKPICDLQPRTLLALTALFLLLTAAGKAGVVVTLKNDALVGGSHIRLLDIASLQGEMITDLSAVYLGRSPEAGSVIHVSRWQIKAQLRAMGVSEEEVVFEGAESVAITRGEPLGPKEIALTDRLSPELEEKPAVSLPEAESVVLPKTVVKAVTPEISERRLLEGAVADVVREFVLKTVAVQGAKVTLEIKRLDSIDFPLNQVASLKVENPPLSVKSGVQSFDIGLFGSESELITTLGARIQVTVALPVVVARTEIPLHSVICKEALAIRYVEKVNADEVFFHDQQLIGQSAKYAMKPGMVVRRVDVQVPPLVVRGQIMTVKARTGAFVVAGSAQAQQEGKAGQVIRVRNMVSGELYSAMVQESGELSLVLPEGE